MRVSTEEQAASGAGMAAQREAIRAEAERRGWTLVKVIEDGGWSAKDLRRPGIAHALAMLRDGEADTLVVAKLDRLSRSMLDFAQFMETAREQSWALVALDVNVDTTTPSGEMVAGVTAVVAQYERRLIGQRTRDGLAAKKAAGVRLGRRSKLPPDVAARIVVERADGRSLRAIADGLQQDGVPTGQGGARWHASSVRAVLAAAGKGSSISPAS
ncbi:MAG: recombinase family protein [Solirubrobacteraceae bacterium]